MITAVMVTGLKRGIAGLPKMAVECFLNQTYKEKELLIVNHGNETYAGKGIREIKVKKTESMHVGALRNLAFDAAKSDWLLIWDDDDWHHPNHMAYQAERTPKGRMSLLQNRIQHDFESECALVHKFSSGFGSTMLFPRNTENRYPNWINDSDAWFRCMFFNRVVLDNPPELYVYNSHGGNLTPKRRIMGSLTEKRGVMEIPDEAKTAITTMKKMLQSNRN
jgi:glycosyltransferase involved in cell wall biosynthesis